MIRVSLYLAVILMALSSLGASSKLIDAPDNLSICNSSDEHPANISAITNRDANGTIDVLIQGWRGFATKDDESLPFRLNVETIRTVRPEEARRLLASNVSIEEVRSLARSKDRNIVLRGRIRLNNDFYRLTDITFASSGKGSTLRANVARSGSEDVISAVGHAFVTMLAGDDAGIAKGYMVIEDSKYSGNYSLLLNKCADPGPRSGMPRGGQQGFGRRKVIASD